MTYTSIFPVVFWLLIQLHTLNSCKLPSPSLNERKYLPSTSQMLYGLSFAFRLLGCFPFILFPSNLEIFKFQDRKAEHVSVKNDFFRHQKKQVFSCFYKRKYPLLIFYLLFLLHVPHKVTCRIILLHHIAQILIT